MKAQHDARFYELAIWPDSVDLPDGDPDQTLYISQFPEDKLSRTDHAENLADGRYYEFSHVPYTKLRELKHRDDLVPFEDKGCIGLTVAPANETPQQAEPAVVDLEAPQQVRRSFIDEDLRKYGFMINQCHPNLSDAKVVTR